jgi:DNA modification methylase
MTLYCEDHPDRIAISRVNLRGVLQRRCAECDREDRRLQRVELIEAGYERATMHDMLNQILTGDARELSKSIPDGSIDLIFTDPEYEKIEDYAWLAAEAARALKPGGSLLCFQWAAYLRETLNALNPLKLEWVFSLYIPNRTKDTRCKAGFNKWTPCLWLSRGDAKSPRTADIMQCNAFQAVYGSGKSNHIWSKSPEFFVHYIEAFTKPGAICYDPFAGGGTLAAAAKITHRNFIAFEIDPTRADAARERVADTQPMCPILLGSQEAMDFDTDRAA